MTYRLIIKDRANLEIEDAVWYYEKKRKGLGESFLKELDHTFILISNVPELFNLKYRNTREVLIKRFPFLVVYEIEGETVIVYSVFHARQNPRKKYRSRF